MAANFKAMGIFSGSATNPLGSILKEAGATISGGVVQIQKDTPNNRWQPRVATAAGTPPAGYGVLTAMMSFNLGKSSANPTATYSILTSLAGSDTFDITENTSGQWVFKASTVTILTFTPTGTHHIYWLMDKAGAVSWNGGDSIHVTLCIDRVVVFDGNITAGATVTTVPFGPYIFGQTTGDATTATFTVSGFCIGWTDRAANIGKVTPTNWTLRLGQTPPTGYDEGGKSSGTDGAALVDEAINAAPNGSGTTDSDDFDVVNDAGLTQDKQAVRLAASLLAAGATCYSVIIKAWTRAVAGTKLTGAAYGIHDGTNPGTTVGGSLITAPTSYAEDARANSEPIIIHSPPSGTWASKTNTELDAMSAIVENTQASANSSMRIDAVNVEAAIVLADSEINLTPIFLRRQRPNSPFPDPAFNPSIGRHDIGLFAQPAVVVSTGRVQGYII